MNWFFKTASAVTLSLCLFGTAHAQSNELSFRVTQGAVLDGQSTSFNVDMTTGKYTITTDGGIAHFIMIRGQGTLSQAQLKSLETAITKVKDSHAPANLPGLVPGSPEFTIDADGTQVSGALNMKGAIEDAKQNHQDVSAWKVIEPIVNKFQKLETKLEADYHPTLPAPDKKAPFDELSIEEHNSWTGGVDKLTVKSDGTYTLERSLGQSTLTGTLTKAQLDAIVKAYDANTLKADNGKFVGQVIPDDTMFTVSTTENGQTYKVNGSVDSSNLGPLQALEKVLVGDVNSLQPPVAQPLAGAGDNTKDESLLGKAKSFFEDSWSKFLGNKDAVTAAKTSADATGRAPRGVGMSNVLDGRVVDGSSKADGKDAADDGR